MNFITGFQADRLISQISEEADPTAPAAKKAFDKLGKLGTGAVPKILEAIGMADKKQSAEYVGLLGKLVSDKSLPIITRGLADDDPRAVAGTVAALSGTRAYNINRLVDLLGEDEYSKSAIIEILTVHKERLNVNQLLAQIYYLQPAEKAALFKLINEIISVDHVPDLLARMDGKDPVVKMHIIDTLSQFNTPEVHQALRESLGDSNKLVRKSALTSIASGGIEVSIDVICELLLDSDVDVINKASDVVVSRNHPETAKYLIEAMKSENEFSRRAAVEILNEIGTTNSIKFLLEAVADEDWWVRSRASDALARIGGDRVVSAVLALVKDDDENIRRAAIEILNSCGDKRAVDHLIEATRDPDWWVSERAADALAGIGDKKAVPAILKMLDRNDKSLPVALTTLGKLGDARLLTKVLPFLQRPEKEVRLAAIETVTMLTDEQNSEAVRSHIEHAMALKDPTIARAAAKAMQKLEGRFSASGQYIGTGVLSASAVVPSKPVAAAPASQAPIETTSGTAPAKTLLIEGRDLADVTASSPEAQMLDVSALKPGDMIENRYKYIEKIGKGAFGTVVLVEDTIVDERLILKFLNPNVASDEEMLKRFVHELRYSRKVTHKNVIRIYDFLYVGGGYAISMEYFPSHTLGVEIANEKPMAQRKAVGYAIDISTGMQIAHHVGIVHRDLKPANILINDAGLLKIVDFGVAAAASSGDTQLTKTGYVIGSPKYMAPEQILGKKVDIRADIYSLGVILYEMLAGQPPYSRGDHMAVMYQHVQGNASPLSELNPNLPARLVDIVTMSMMVDKNKRFASMEAFHDALNKLVPELA